MPRAASFAVRPDLPRRHDFAWLAHSGIFGDALAQSACCRFEATQHVLLDAVRNSPPEQVPAEMRRCFGFVEKLPPGSQLIEIE